MTADEIERLRAENELLTAENKKWQEHDDAIRAEFGYKRDGRATIECLRETFNAKWSEEEALFQATLKMKTEELRAALQRMLLEFDFMVESKTIPDVRNDIIFVEARAALEGKEPRIVT